jgi:O-antigen ligase
MNIRNALCANLVSLPAMVGPALLGLLGLLASLAVAGVLVTATSPAMPVLIVLVLGAAIWIFGGKQPDTAFLFLIFFTAPIDIAKSIVSPTSLIFIPDAPGLSISLMDVAFIAWSALWLWRRITIPHPPLRLTKTDLAVLAFMFWIWFKSAQALSGGLGIATAIMYTKFIVVFFVMSHSLDSSQDWRTVVRASVIIFALQIVYVAAQIALGSPLPLPGAKVPDFASLVSLGTEGVAFRPVGFFNHPNPLADYLVLLLPVPLAMVIAGKRRLPRQVWWAALGMLLIGVAVLARTYSRGGWVCFGFAALVCVAYFWHAGIIAFKQIALGVIVVSMALALAVTLNPGLLLRITGNDSRSNESRGLLKQQAMAIIRDHPLAGVGFASYNRASRDYTPEGWAKITHEYRKALRQLVVHNHYLLLAAETGIPAMLLFAAIFTSLILRGLWRVCWADPGLAAITVGLSAGLAGNMLFLSSDNYYVDIRMSLLWLVGGLLQARLIHGAAVPVSAPSFAAPFAARGGT